MLTPELTEEEKRELHSKALDLYKLYLKPTASHKVAVSTDLVQEIYSSEFRIDLFSVDVHQLNLLESLCHSLERSYRRRGSPEDHNANVQGLRGGLQHSGVDVPSILQERTRELVVWTK